MPALAIPVKSHVKIAWLAALLLAGLLFVPHAKAQQPAPAAQSMPGMDMTKPMPAAPAPAAQSMPGMDMSKPMPAAPAPAAQSMPGMDMSKPMPAAPAAGAPKAPMAPMAPMAMITPEQAKLIGVTVTQAAVKPFKASIRATGRVAADETRLATVTTKVEGFVESLMVNYTGQAVTKGQALLSLYSPEVYAVELEYLSLLRMKQAGAKTAGAPDGQFGGLLQSDTQALLAAARQRLALLDAGGLAGQLEKTGRPSRTFTLVSPVNGYVINRQATLGMRVMPGEKLYDLADLSTVWVLADVFEENLPYVRLGTHAAITLTGVGGQPYMATVAQIYPVIAGDTRTARVRFNLPNPKGLLKPEMYAVVLMEPELGNYLAVPESALIDTGLRRVVYQETSLNTFEPRDVTTGLHSGGFVAITGGLAPGARVATSANFLLDAETRLKSGEGGDPMAGMDMGQPDQKK